MKRVIPGLVLFIVLVPAAATAQFEKLKDSVVQLYGVVMTADSLQGIPSEEPVGGDQKICGGGCEIL